MAGLGGGGLGHGAAFFFEVALAELEGAFGGVGSLGAFGLEDGGFAGGVLFLLLEVVGAEVVELADEGLGAGEEAAVVVPEAGEGGGLVLKEVEGGEGEGGVGGRVLSDEA